MFKKVITIAGVPRSGTSWLGQIFDSSPNVAYKYQPLFSWAFKNALGLGSSKEEYESFFRAIYESDDEFINRTKERKMGINPIFTKFTDPEILVFKHTRYHYLLEKMIQFFPDIKAVGIVRHPCGTINSFLTNPREFPSDADPYKEWRYAYCRNTGPEEYFGFEKWKEASYLFIRLEKKYPNNFKIIKYEELVDETIKVTKDLFNILGIEYGHQTQEFLKSSHKRHEDHIDAVFKDKKVKDRWRRELDNSIISSIMEEIDNTPLKRFI